jgi:hypothetical protein
MFNIINVFLVLGNIFLLSWFVLEAYKQLNSKISTVLAGLVAGLGLGFILGMVAIASSCASP